MRSLHAGIILAALLAAASCGDDSTGPGDALTRDEVLALVEVSASQGFTLTEEVVIGSETFTPDGSAFELTVPCPAGGTVGVDGRATLMGEPDGERFAVAFSATLVHSGCTIPHEEAGIAFTLDGAPELEMGIELAVTGDFDLEVSGTFEGAVRWATDDGRRGSCRMDLEIGAMLNEAFGVSATLDGEACGIELMESVTGLLEL